VHEAHLVGVHETTGRTHVAAGWVRSTVSTEAAAVLNRARSVLVQRGIVVRADIPAGEKSSRCLKNAVSIAITFFEAAVDGALLHHQFAVVGASRFRAVIVFAGRCDWPRRGGSGRSWRWRASDSRAFARLQVEDGGFGGPQASSIPSIRPKPPGFSPPGSTRSTLSHADNLRFQRLECHLVLPPAPIPFILDQARTRMPGLSERSNKMHKPIKYARKKP